MAYIAPPRTSIGTMPARGVHFIFELHISFPQAYGSLSSKDEMMLFNVIEEHKSSLLVPGGRGSELDWFPWLRFIMRDVHNELMKIVNSHWFVFDSLLQRKKVS